MLYIKDSATWRVCLLALCISTAFFYGQEKSRIRGVAANCTWGHTVSDPETQPCSLRPLLRFAALESRSLRTPSLEADGLRPANALPECWNRHATNTSEVRLASVTPSTLNPTCEPMTYSLGARDSFHNYGYLLVVPIIRTIILGGLY